jgi:SAM-dependent methyltransferase
VNHCSNDHSAGNPLEQVRSLYTDLALHPEKDFGWGKGRENARSLGYAGEWLSRLPDSVWESAAAVGNPFSLGPAHAGETVVDIGCGAGADVCIAALLVGKEGRVIGIDCTPAMIARATENATAAGLSQVVCREADMTRLPLPDGSADIIISNRAINLAVDKRAVLGEAFRVLRPGGRLQIADMVRDRHAGDSACRSGNESWADCVSGTVEPDAFLAMLTEAGFSDARLAGFTGYRTAGHTTGALFRAVRPG